MIKTNVKEQERDYRGMVFGHLGFDFISNDSAPVTTVYRVIHVIADGDVTFTQINKSSAVPETLTLTEGTIIYGLFALVETTGDIIAYIG